MNKWYIYHCKEVCEVKLLSRVLLFVTQWTVTYQAPRSMEFSRQEYWSGLPFPSPGDLPNPGIEPRSPALQTDTLPSEPLGKPTLNVSYYIKTTYIYIYIKYITLINKQLHSFHMLAR